VIPRIFRRIWLGDRQLPPEHEAYWEELRRLHPGWTFQTLHAPDDLINGEIFASAPTLAAKADIMRYEILLNGGIYVDTDIEPLRSFEPLLSHGFFAGFEDENYLCNAVIGAERGHPAVKALVGALPGWVSGRGHETTNVQTGPLFITTQLLGRDDVTLLPETAFYPVHHTSRDFAGEFPDSYAVHHWAASWL